MTELRKVDAMNGTSKAALQHFDSEDRGHLRLNSATRVDVAHEYSVELCRQYKLRKRYAHLHNQVAKSLVRDRHQA